MSERQTDVSGRVGRSDFIMCLRIKQHAQRGKSKGKHDRREADKITVNGEVIFLPSPDTNHLSVLFVPFGAIMANMMTAGK